MRRITVLLTSEPDGGFEPFRHGDLEIVLHPWSRSGPLPLFDFIFTVCANAAGETCPVWPGRPISAHWGIPDPAAVEGEGQHRAFVVAFAALRHRMSLFTSLPLAALDELAMTARLKAIGNQPERGLA